MSLAYKQLYKLICLGLKANSGMFNQFCQRGLYDPRLFFYIRNYIFKFISTFKFIQTLSDHTLIEKYLYRKVALPVFFKYNPFKSVLAIAYGKHLACAIGSYIKILNIDDLSSISVVKTLQGGHTDIYILNYSNNHKLLCFVETQRTICILNADEDYSEVKNITLDKQVNCIAFSPCNNFLAFGSEQNVYVWNLETGYYTIIYTTPPDTFAMPVSLCYDPTGQYIYIGCIDRIVKIDPKTKEQISILTTTLKCLCLSNNYIFTSHANQIINIWNKTDLSHMKQLDYSADGSDRHNTIGQICSFGNVLCVVADWNESMKIWNVETGQKLHHFLQRVTSVCYWPKHDLIINGTYDGLLIRKLKL